MSANNGTQPYQVSCTPRVMARLNEWRERATAAGRQLWYAAELRELERRLQAEPRVWGDPQYGYHGLNLILYRRYGPTFVVYYAVHNTQPVVIVQEIELMEGGPLSGGPGAE